MLASEPATERAAASIPRNAVALPFEQQEEQRVHGFLEDWASVAYGARLGVALLGQTNEPGAASIDRSAGIASKGPRLQRIRAGRFLLDAIAEDHTVQAYAAVEADGDAFYGSSTATVASAYAEEDKNYDLGTSLTFASRAILNTVVIFLDTWFRWNFSSNLRLGFYTTAQVGREKTSDRTTRLNLELPNAAILELLAAQNYDYEGLLPCVKSLVLDEYESQYSSPDRQGNLDVIDSWKDNEWKLFLGRIKWQFAALDEKACADQLIEAIKKCRHYHVGHEGKEDILLAAILDLLDKRQSSVDHSQRFVKDSDIELIFLKVENGSILRTDPTWEVWDTIPKPTDRRNVTEKLVAAFPKISPETLARYQRRTSAGHVEYQAHANDKNVLALRYQVFEACADALLATNTELLSEAQLVSHLENLVKVAVARVGARSSAYHYMLTADSFVSGMVLTLLDSCYLSFDKASS